MARPGVTYLDVSNAAQQLVAAGRTPTIETIRMTLGSGSNSTLGTHLRTWKSKQDQTQQIASKENIPEEFISALKGVWERVMNHAEDKIQVIHQETQQELIQFREDITRLQKDHAASQQQLQQIKQERDVLTNEKSALEQWLADAKIEIATLSEKLLGADQQNLEKQARIDELHRQNQQAQTNLEHYRAASLEQRLADQQRYEQQQKQLEHTLREANQELAQLRHEKLTLQQHYQQATFENNNIKAQLDTLHSQQASTTSQLTDALSELAKKTQDQQHWQERFFTLQSKHEQQNQSLLELHTQHAVLMQQSETTTKALNELRDQHTVLAHEKWILGQEKAQLYGQLKQCMTTAENASSLKMNKS